MTGSLQVRPKFTRLCALFRSVRPALPFPFSRSLSLYCYWLLLIHSHTHTAHNLRRKKKNKERISNQALDISKELDSREKWPWQDRGEHEGVRTLSSEREFLNYATHTPSYYPSLSGQFKLTNRLKFTFTRVILSYTSIKEVGGGG